jgi:peptidoglycan/LPS O-acetylase OafA/YrhL
MPPSTARIRQIDVLKGLAILGVIVQHAFTSRALDESWDTLHVGQAVPVFFVIMGLNAAQSMARQRARFVGDLYDSDYVRGRVQRLVSPIIVIWPLALVVALLAGEAHIGPLVLVGVLPISSAPGNYFVTIMLEFAVLFPVAFWCFTRFPVGTTLVVVAADVGFELLAPHVHALGGAGPAHGYIYEAAIVKYGLAILAGMWLSRVEVGRRGFALLSLCALGSIAYLVVVHQDPNGFTWLVSSFSRTTNFISIFYAVWLTYVGIRLLPAQSPRPAYRALEKLGRASYHVFLVQIVWFGAAGAHSWPMAIIGILASSAIGYLFFVAMTPGGLAAVRSPRQAGRTRADRTAA